MSKPLKSWQKSLAITAGFVVSLAIVRWMLSLISDWLFTIGVASDNGTNIPNQFIQLLVYSASAILPLCIGLYAAKLIKVPFGLLEINKRHIVIAFLLIFLPFFALIWAGSAVGALSLHDIFPKFPTLYSIVWVIFVIFLTYLSCLLEEAFFRGAILSSYMSTIHAPVATIILSSAFFAACHADWQMEPLFSRAILGLGLAWVTWRSGSIGMATGFHFAINLASNVLSAPMGINALAGRANYSHTPQENAGSWELVIFHFSVMILASEILRMKSKDRHTKLGRSGIR